MTTGENSCNRIGEEISQSFGHAGRGGRRRHIERRVEGSVMVWLINRTREGIEKDGGTGVKGRGEDMWVDVTGEVRPISSKRIL